MKIKIYVSILFIILSVITSFATDYYYYCGEKVLLTVDSTHLVSIVPLNSVENIPAQFGQLDTIQIEDSRSRIRIHDVSKSTTRMSTIPVNFYKCYKNEGGVLMVPNGYINIKLKDASDRSLIKIIESEYNVKMIAQDAFMPLWYSFQVLPQASKSSVELANKLYETGQFAACFPSFSIDAREISYDPYVLSQWGLYNTINQAENYDINISEAWCYATGRGINVAIIDDGIDINHIDLSENIAELSYDAETDTSQSKVYGQHGTHCAGIIGAVRNNGTHICGVAPDVKLIPISVDLYYGTDSERKLAQGINWAWQNGADILSCSWRCERNELVKDAIENATTKGRRGNGCLFIKSAGNSYGAITFPGDVSKNVFAIGNMNSDGMIAGDSSFGKSLLLVAPGSRILSTIPDDKLSIMSGTSMACPHVSGVVALMLERNSSLTVSQVREILAKSASKVGIGSYDVFDEYGLWDLHYGYGLLDAYQAVIMTPRK